MNEIKCSICGRITVPGNNENGLPNVVGFVRPNGEIVNVCAECICRIGHEGEVK